MFTTGNKGHKSSTNLKDGKPIGQQRAFNGGRALQNLPGSTPALPGAKQ
jgi:hypothetical protein